MARPVRTTTRPSAARSRAPGAPSGHGSVPPGTRANTRASCAIAVVGTTPAHATSSAPRGHTTEVSEAATPATVATGTSGAARRFARTPTTLTDPWRRTTRGAVISWAATGTASAGPSGARRRGRRAPMASPHGRVKRRRPSVATEDSAKPKERASHGSSASTTTIAAPSTGSPADRRERLRPRSPIAPMAAARTTLGSGRARTTNPARATRARTGRARLGTPSSTHRARTSPVTTATLLPLTAVRCVIPVARIASVRSAGVRLVSPMTRPGSNPRASAGAESTDARSPARNRSAPDATAPGGVITSGAPATASVATRSSARSAGPRRPCTRTVERHSSAARRSSPVSSTGAPTALRAPRASRSSIVPSRRARVSSSRPARTNGSPVTTTTAVTAARSAASASTPPRARSVACAAAATWSSSTSTRASTSGQRSGRARQRTSGKGASHSRDDR